MTQFIQGIERQQSMLPPNDSTIMLTKTAPSPRWMPLQTCIQTADRSHRQSGLSFKFEGSSTDPVVNSPENGLSIHKVCNRKLQSTVLSSRMDETGETQISLTDPDTHTKAEINRVSKQPLRLAD